MTALFEYDTEVTANESLVMASTFRSDFVSTSSFSPLISCLFVCHSGRKLHCIIYCVNAATAQILKERVTGRGHLYTPVVRLYKGTGPLRLMTGPPNQM